MQRSFVSSCCPPLSRRGAFAYDTIHGDLFRVSLAIESYLELHELPALLLRRAALCVHRHRAALRFALRRLFQARAAAVLLFGVELLGFGCRSPALGQRDDRDLPGEFAGAYGQAIARLEDLRRLRPLAVELHLAALDRLGRDRARLEKPGRPQPLVDSNARCLVV